MGCSSCSSGGCGSKSSSVDGSPAGCKSNGGCSTGGCNRLNVFDWLSDMEIPVSFKEFDIVEVRFKGGRKEFFRNINRIQLTTGDAVVVDVPNGHHIGHVSLKGELVRLQMRKKKVENNEEIRTIYRIATEKDMEKFNSARELEAGTMYRARAIIQELSLKMKLSDVEYQADRTKATFFYSADDRVDFRELIKKLAEEFKVRIEMRQISLRHEAGRLGGIGSCGRELCCSTWLTDFRSVSTTAARYQNLSLNPSKLSGQCGRLKCCLNYELETYMEALKDIPNVNRPLQTRAGDAILQKTDIFRRIMWFGYKGDSNWFPVTVERVQEVLKMNSQGEMPENLAEEVKKQQPEVVDFVEVLEGNLDRMDEKYSNGTGGKKKRKKKKKGNQTATEVLAQATPTPEVRRDKADPGKPFGGNKKQPEREPSAKQAMAEARPKPERPERTERPERAERTERPERTERTERPEKAERQDRAERPDRGERPAREHNRGGQHEGRPRPERNEANKPGAVEAKGEQRPPQEREGNRPQKHNRPNRPERGEQRPERSERPHGQQRERGPQQPSQQMQVPKVKAEENLSGNEERAPRPEGQQRSRRSRNRNNRGRRAGASENTAPNTTPDA